MEDDIYITTSLLTQVFINDVIAHEVEIWVHVISCIDLLIAFLCLLLMSTVALH